MTDEFPCLDEDFEPVDDQGEVLDAFRPVLSADARVVVAAAAG